MVLYEIIQNISIAEAVFYSSKSCAAPTDQTDSPVTCSDGFFYDLNATGCCRPECGTFGRIKKGLAIVEHISVCVGLVAALLMLVLALTIQRSSL